MSVRTALDYLGILSELPSRERRLPLFRTAIFRL